MIKNLYVNEKISCPREIIYTKDFLPNFRAPFISPEESFIEDREITLPVLMKDGSIGSVTLTDWMVYAGFDGFDRYFTEVSIDNKVKPSDRHIELWINENSNNIQIIYAVPSFPVETVCVDRNFNADGLYLFLREKELIKIDADYISKFLNNEDYNWFITYLGHSPVSIEAFAEWSPEKYSQYREWCIENGLTF